MATKMAARLILGLFTTVACLALVRCDVLFEYGTSVKDEEFPTNPVPSEIELGVKFRFYGEQYEKIYISPFGHISFGVKPSPIVKKEFLPYDANTHHDPPMAAVYFAKISTTSVAGESSDARSKIYYRKVQGEVGSNYPEILKTLGHEVRINSVRDMSRFWPNKAVIVTWHNVRHYECTQTDCPRNTFQAAILTDDVHTYAIYNYRNLTWRGGILQGCDPDTGLGAACFSAQVGFNSGKGREFTPLLLSGTERVVDLPKHHGSKVMGRYINHISTRKIFRDACSSVEKTLAIYPRETGMLGGSEVHIAGPCLADTSKPLTCQVGTSWDIKATILDSGRISCVTPIHYGTGEVPLKVKYDSQTYEGTINIATPNLIYAPVYLDNYTDTWMRRNPAELHLSWDPLLLNHIFVHPDDANVTISPPLMNKTQVNEVIIALFGYAEITNGQEVRPHWKQLAILNDKHGKENDGKFRFNPSGYRCKLGKACDLWQIGAVKILPSTAKDVDKDRGIFSKIVPIGWFVEEHMVKEHGDQWPDKLCRDWKDQAEVDWEKDLLKCPCTRSQAYTNVGQFIVDADCDGSGPCPLHSTASICFISRMPTDKGAQTRCCYKAVKDQIHEELIYSSAVETGGSFSAAAHEHGLYPYMLAKKHYPIFSNWIMDKLPMIWCCVWSHDKDLCLTRYEPRRKGPECERGQSTQSAFAFGDPHFQTFDGTHYTFNGFAEYWLLLMDRLTDFHNFKLQARMDNYVGSVRDLNATVITGVAMQQGNAGFPKVSLFLNSPLALDRISVYIDGVYQEFITVDWREIFDKSKKHALYIKRHGDDMSSKNYTLAFSNGVSVNVAEDVGMLQVKITAPLTFYNKTQGLFGLWDGNQNNDLQTRNGKVHVNPNNTKDVHEKFGAGWAVKKDESIFYYAKGDSWKLHQKSTFEPVYNPTIPQGSKLTKAKVDETCKGEKFCTYDYIVTLDEKVAIASLAAQTWAAQVKIMSSKVDVCPYLNIGMSKRSVESSNVAGGKTTFTSCVNGYTLVGPKDFECVAQQGRDAAWAPAPSATICKSDTEISAEKTRTAVAISVPLVLVFLIILIAIAGFMVFRRKKAQKEAAPQSALQPDDLPKQEPPVNPNPSLYTYPEAKLNLSKTSVSSKASKKSDNSIVLNQVIHAQRPPRPVKGQKQAEDPAQPQRYANVPGEYDNTGYNPVSEHQPPYEPREMQPPHFQAPQPPTGGYDNQASDVLPVEGNVPHANAAAVHENDLPPVSLRNDPQPTVQPNVAPQDIKPNFV